ncbi:MAG: class I SAM-dependent methyltransferase [Bacteroidales bacterium]|nr:class I SAM-dependent methyltransferase [Bacteroidales bacterium]
MNIATPTYWTDYELIDSGNFKKLERFGNFITIRPEPQAVWDPYDSIEIWKKMAHVEFVPTSANSGQWKKYKSMPDQWKIQYPIHGIKDSSIILRLALTSFKHVGVFPEQAYNWEFIYDQCKNSIDEPTVLNLFAYTGAASLVAAKAKAKVVHVDSVKQIVNWASTNAQLNDLSTIRWIIDDATKFVKREIRRGKKYQGIILDPPAFGHGPNGEDWKLERDINQMLKLVAELADSKNFFLVLNVYSLGLSVLVLENLIQSNFNTSKYDSGELYLQDKYGKKLPLGVFVQLKK